MNATGTLIVLAGLLLLGLSIWGLFNRGRSIFCALAGILVLLGASLGAWIAWMETNSALGTAIYLAIALAFDLAGLRTLLRQALNRRPGLSTAPR